MAGNLFKEAAAYRKKHPKVTQAEAVKIVAKKNRAPKKKAAVKPKAKAVGKATAAPAAKKVKIKLGRKGRATVSIGSISMDRLQRELRDNSTMKQKLSALQQVLKDAAKSGKAEVRRDIAKVRTAISASNKHITALKRTI
jgi:hypothetical protein